MKKYFKLLIASISFIIFIILCIFVLTKNNLYLDTAVYNFLSKFISDDLTKNLILLTNIGSAITVIVITLFVMIFLKNKKYGILMSINLICITVIQVILKNIFMRARPISINLIEESGYSFPSGHSLTVMAFYGLIIYFIYKSKLEKRSKTLYISLFIIFIIITGLSRIYLGVHYFTDVLGGFSFSIFYLTLYINIIKKWLG